MKKMLVVFLILFTKALADSDEDKYVDLLPDEEKQQFLDIVARRILKDVESHENVTNAKSGEMSDEQLKQHTEYVKSILKEEQANVRRSKGGNEEKPNSVEKDNLGVKPLTSEKISLSDEQADLTLRKDKKDGVSDESTTNHMKNEMVTNSAPIIKRSVHNEHDTNKSNESQETNSTNEKSETDRLASESKDSPNSTKDKDSEIATSTKARDEDIERETVEGNLSGSSESNGRNVSVKGINELGSRRLNNEDNKTVESTTESNRTTTAVESVKLTGNKSNDYNNVSTAAEESTMSTYPFETSTQGNNESTTTDDPLYQTTTELSTNVVTNLEPVMKSSNDTLKDIESKLDTTTKIIRRSTINDKTTTTEPVPETTETIPETTTGAETEMTEVVTSPTTDLDTPKHTTVSRPVVTTEETKIEVEEFTSSPAPATSTKPQNKKKKYTTVKQRTEEPRELTTAAPEHDEESVEATTKNIIRHKVVLHQPQKVIIGPRAKNKADMDQDGVLQRNFIDLEKVYYDNNYKVKVGKQYHVYEIPAGGSAFIKDEEPVADQPYYVPIYNYSPNNVYFNPQNRLGPNAEDFGTGNIITEYDDINQQDKTETFNVKMEYDRTFENKRKKFGSKNIVSQNSHNEPLQKYETHKKKVNPEDYLESDYYFGTVRDALARRVGKMNFNKFPNSDEMDHPARSIQEGSLKDHVRAVRNILFHHKSFGLLDKDKYGASIEQLRMGHKRSDAKQAVRHGVDDAFKTTNSKNNHKNTVNENNIALDYDFASQKATITTDVEDDEIRDKLFKKVGYLKKKNDTKELYVMDDLFKANVEKYIKESGLARASSLPDEKANSTKLNQRDKVIALLRLSARQKNVETNNINNVVRSGVDSNGDINNRPPYPMNIPVYSNEMNNSEKALDVKFNLRRNEVDKVQVYTEVLKDMIALDNKAFVQYDWLGTTVDIQSALQKLFELTALVADDEDIHPADMEILKYVLFQHKLATEIIEANDFGAQLRKKLALPRNRKRKLKPRMLKEKGLINRVWLYLRKEVPQVNESGALKNLNTFLINVEDSLYDLHDAIKNIAIITKYKNQHWYENLRDLYLKTDEKHILELLLHLTALRLFSLIEESAKNGLENDYVQYMKQNRKHCKRTLEEMMCIIDILDEYNKYVE